MTVIKLTSSGKGVQVITDDGEVFGTSRAYLMSLLSGTLKQPFILCSRMPFDVNPDRFKKSPLWVPQDMDKAYLEEQQKRKEQGLKNVNDALSIKTKKENQERKRYMSDDNVW